VTLLVRAAMFLVALVALLTLGGSSLGPVEVGLVVLLLASVAAVARRRRRPR
jgi:hypothetical protein